MTLNDLDPTDVGILNLLQENSRLTNKEISAKTNKSLSAVHARIKKLEDSGIIRKSVTLLDRNKINKDVAVFAALKITDHSNAALTEFEKHISAFAEVMECYHVSGKWDFILKIVVGNMVDYKSFILEKLSMSPFIGPVESLFVISESKSETAFFLKHK